MAQQAKAEAGSLAPSQFTHTKRKKMEVVVVGARGGFGMQILGTMRDFAALDLDGD